MRPAEKPLLPTALLRFWLWTLAITALSLVYTEAMIHLLHSRSTLGPAVLWNNERWWDFLAFQDRFEHFRTPQFWAPYDYPFTYPAPMAVLFAALYRIPHALRFYLLGCVAALGAGAVATARAIAARGYTFVAALGFALTIPVLAWPVWLLLGSANTEGLVALLTAAGMFAFLRRRWMIASAAFACAGSLKLFPLVLLALLWSAKRYREFVAGIVLFVLVTVASLAFVGPTVGEAAHRIGAGLLFVKQTYALNRTPQSLDVNHSLFSPVKFATLLLLHGVAEPSREATLNTAFRSYCAGAAIFGVALYWMRIRYLPVLNQMLALVVCAVLLPPYSVDYTLIHLFVPCALLCVYASEEEVRGQAAAFACFTFLFPIATFFTARYRFGSQVRMLALCGLLAVALRFPFAWTRLDGALRADAGAPA